MFSAAAAVVSLSSCGDSPDKKASKRAAELGFVTQLPKDTGFVLGCYNTNELWQKLRSTAIAKTLYNTDRDGKDMLAPIPLVAEEVMIQNIVGQEVVVAQAGDVAGKWKDWSEFMSLSNNLDMLTFLGMDIQKEEAASIHAKLEALAPRLGIPTTIVALKNDEPNFTLIKTIVQGKIDELNKENPGAVEPVSVKIGKNSFEGYRFNIKSLAKEKVDNVFSLLNEKTSEALMNKQVTFVMGRVAGNSVFILADKLDGFAWAQSPSQSVAGNEGFAFMDQYAGKKPALMAYVDKAVIENGMNSSAQSTLEMGKIVNGLIKNTGEKFKVDTTQVENSLTVLFTDYLSLENYTMKGISNVGVFGWMDKGVNVEINGMPTSWCMPDQALKFSGAADADSTLLHYEAAVNPENAQLSWKVYGDMGAVLLSVVDAAGTSPALGAYKKVSEAARASLVQMGAGIKMMGEQGMGLDGALVMGAPAGDDKVRLLYLSEVKDQAKVKEGWTMFSLASNTLGKTVMNAVNPNVGAMWDMFVPAAKSSPMVVNGQEFNFSETDPLAGLPVPVTFASALSDKTVGFGVTASYVRSALETAMKSEAREMKGFSLKINIPVLAKGIKTMGDDTEDIAPVLDAVSSELKSVESGLIKRDGKYIYTFQMKSE